MRWMFLILFCLFARPGRAHAADLTGQWKLHSMIYRGEDISLPNPDLNLRFDFKEDGTERLYWDRGSEDFCERWAHFSLQDDWLQEEVYAVNPDNAFECKKDPDMQVGHQTKTKISIQKSELRLFFQLGEEELVYVLQPLPL